MSEVVKKKSLFSSTGKFFKEVKSELKKVTWPTRKQIFKNTLIVLIFLAIMTIIITSFDYLFTQLLGIIL